MIESGYPKVLNHLASFFPQPSDSPTAMENTPAPLAPGANRETILNYCQQKFTQALLEAASASGIRMPELLKVLSQGARRAFEDLAGLRSREEFVRLRGLTASRISLVHPEDMDLTVALINLAHSLSDACEGRLSRLHLLFMTLLDQDTSVVDQLPVGPDAACAALRELCDSDDMPHEMRLDVPSRIEKPLAHALSVLYLDLTDTLSAAGIPPKSLLRSGSDVSAPQAQHRIHPDAAHGTETIESPAVTTPLGRLQSNVMRKRYPMAESSGPGVGAMTDPALLQAIMAQVLQWLTERQSEAARQPYGMESAQVNLGELSGLLPTQSNAALEALNLSFDALLMDRELCAAIKPSLGRLRLPVCKAALLESKLLADSEHPARRLLDIILRLATSLKTDEAATHPVCQAIEAAASQVQHNYAQNPVVFADAAQSLEMLEQRRATEATQRASRLVGLAEREARREQARSRAARAIRALCASAPPEPVRFFLERLWVRVLAHIHQTQGEKSNEWVQALATANQLIESVQPKTDAEGRRHLINILSGLLAQIRAGLESIGTPDALRERAFHSFVALHSAALHGKQADAAARQDVLPPPTPPRVETPREIPGLHVVRLAPDGEPEHDLPDWIAQLKLGDWLQLSLPDSPPQRLRVGWVGGMPRMLLLSQPDTDLTVLLPLRWLIIRAEAQAAVPLPMEALFEGAAEKAIRLAQGYA
ncbi:DUF1631 family protein [Uliginosibacterium gangwonense]|uniref:DUF1631 family protein n=1 Tax=Uliginosibacterium gangwonense TaxID=392736 RepID=UPI00036CBB2B|nr:DUF1631 family protein [Uliginosibacterium gangwonense]